MQMVSADTLAPLQRRLAAIMMLDVAGYSRLTEADVEGTHRRWMTILAGVVRPALEETEGQIINRTGDGAMIEFPSVTLAVRAAIRIQAGAEALEQVQPPDRRIRLRIGINLGDVIVEHSVPGIFGDGVNIAARLEGLAEPGGIVLSETAMQLVDRTDFRFVDLGPQRLKNIARPIRAFAVSRDPPIPPRGAWLRLLPRLKPGRRLLLFAAVLLPLCGGLVDAVVGWYLARVRAQELIMILPFRNLSGNSDDDYLVDAIVDDLTNDLARARQGYVISSTTALSYKGRMVDVREIGRQSGVRYVLEGSFRRSGETLVVNAQLVDARTGGNIWAERFSHESRTLADLEDAMTRRLAAPLDFQVSEVRRTGMVGSFAADGNPLDERLRTMALITGSFTPASSLEARTRLERAVAKDVQSAEDLGLLAMLLVSDYLNNWNGASQADVTRTEILAHRALAIDPDAWRAHYALSQVHRVRAEHEAALKELDRTIELNPSFAVAYAQKGNELLALGQVAAAPEWGIKAATISPRDRSLSVFHWVTGRAYFVAGDYARAVEWLEKSVAERGTVWFSQAWLASALALSGDTRRTADTVARLRRDFPDYTLPRIMEYYDKQERFQNAAIKESLPRLYDGLRKAGLRD
ncbi:adenylate/guanylate cyclase domain-containing protein [Paracraurococcus lichenis]|uniref:Adenylate/guanylate cyclase domain-containing protein n=1 Tax=Paracraurococcus lichenis TaxID=3064888 RepID=A0ABT9E4W9_9PROT|nr:adenylate/guanylate cyclase domain-containing protein [Paracraurococcus sp. LOR1-02]MDO9711214.1 adenylate/guanylate cyclase domain-containing protein [Paracraurococcus sp. LOR1-02]